MSRLVIGISFPEKLLAKIDRERGLVSRSKWVVHALEQAYGPVGPEVESKE